MEAEQILCCNSCGGGNKGGTVNEADRAVSHVDRYENEDAQSFFKRQLWRYVSFYED